jgi:hypothetical protein
MILIMNKVSKAAKLLGSRPKHYSEEEIAKRTVRLAEARKRRWTKHETA